MTVSLFILLAILQVNDAGTTYYALRKGYAQEANPVMRRLMEIIGTAPALLLTKSVVMTALWYWRNDIALAVLCVFYAWVVWRNFEIALKVSKS